MSQTQAIREDCFTNQKRRIATERDLASNWALGKGAERFRCALCGHRFRVGDGWRWVYTGGAHFDTDGKRWGVTNFLTCDTCDGEDAIARWVERHREFYGDRFWALR